MEPESTQKPNDPAVQVIPVIHEQLQVTKEIVETGKVIVHKRVHEEEANVNIPLVQEGYDVKRVAVSKVSASYPSQRQEGDTLIVPVVREILVIEKGYEVTEELHITRTKQQTPYLQQITLLKEEITVERKSTPRP